MPRLGLAIVETTLALLADLGNSLWPDSTLSPSKNPLKTAPRQIDVRLDNAH